MARATRVAATTATTRGRRAGGTTRARARARARATPPVLELPRWDADAAVVDAFAAAAVRAAHEVGVFYLRLDPGAIDGANGVVERARAFFASSDEEKDAIAYARSPSFRGYMADGVENTNGARDRREQIEFGVEGTYERVVGERYYERLIGPNQWPTSDGGRLRTEVERFQRDMDDVCRRLTRFLAMGLGCDDAFDDAFARPNVQMKLCRYPPTDDSEFGVGEHSDSGFLTLLVQDDVGGLQVKNPDTGEWIDAPPIPGTVVVNLGEMIQLVTGGYLIATPHRVRNSSTQSRFSVPWFWNPCLDYRVEPIELPEDLPWCRPKPAEGSFRTTASHGGDNVVHDCYGANAFKSLARSHPAVTAIHHSDLEILSSGAVVHRDPSTR